MSILKVEINHLEFCELMKDLLTNIGNSAGKVGSRNSFHSIVCTGVCFVHRFE